jgi:hypothetical protein
MRRRGTGSEGWGQEQLAGAGSQGTQRSQRESKSASARVTHRQLIRMRPHAQIATPDAKYLETLRSIYRFGNDKSDLREGDAASVCQRKGQDLRQEFLPYLHNTHGLIHQATHLPCYVRISARRPAYGTELTSLVGLV